LYSLEDLPEFKRFQAANPGSRLDAEQAIIMFGRAIHWLSILEIIWPDFEAKDYFSVEVAYLVCNDPEDKDYPPAFYQQLANTVAMFWRIKLDALYPDGDWAVDVGSDPEITVEAIIRKRG